MISRADFAKIIAAIAGVVGFLVASFVALRVLAEDRRLDISGTLSGSWFACVDHAGNNIAWFALITPLIVIVVCGAIGWFATFAVRYAWRLLERDTKDHA